MVSDGVILGLIAGLYISNAGLFLYIGKALKDIEKTAQQAERNTEWLHEHNMKEDNPHPKNIEDCPLCN